MSEKKYTSEEVLNLQSQAYQKGYNEGYELRKREHPQPGPVWVKASVFKYEVGVAYSAKDSKSRGAGSFDESGIFKWGDDSLTLPHNQSDLLILDESPAEQPVAKPYDDLYRLVFSNLAKLRARTQDNERMIQMADNIRSIIEDVTNKMLAMPQTDPVNDQWQLHQSAAEQPVYTEQERLDTRVALRILLKLFRNGKISEQQEECCADVEAILKKYSRGKINLKAEQPGREVMTEIQFTEWQAFLSHDGLTFDGEYYYDEENNFFKPAEVYQLFKEQKEAKP